MYLEAFILGVLWAGIVFPLLLSDYDPPLGREDGIAVAAVGALVKKREVPHPVLLILALVEAILSALLTYNALGNVFKGVSLFVFIFTITGKELSDAFSIFVTCSIIVRKEPFFLLGGVIKLILCIGVDMLYIPHLLFVEVERELVENLLTIGILGYLTLADDSQHIMKQKEWTTLDFGRIVIVGIDVLAAVDGVLDFLMKELLELHDIHIFL